MKRIIRGKDMVKQFLFTELKITSEILDNMMG